MITAGSTIFSHFSVTVSRRNFYFGTAVLISTMNPI
jgi:hypothetical protein